ncbi:HAD-IA family hydrolase [Arthrobacter sp. NEB 688]|uniref:HAD family hydrolase n=1 Tax=Arthrobacter sp. NEB 688 TaxID=904039 RepID=UPI001565FF52|nr:HAD-IA family hydrolase [Arthrobacter sp. NEB 688]QKE83420.1 HAD-IA family hydrolase [Arthrobacter sp. NEB 688]
MTSSTPLPEALRRDFGAVLLDMDGTLIDSIAAVERSWLRWCEEHGVDPRRLTGSHGVTARNLIAGLLPEDRRDAAYERIVELEVADVGEIEVLPGTLDLLTALRDGGVPTAIVTSSSDPLAEARLTATALPHPEVVVTADHVVRGKPFPDPWLLGAERLGVDPADCLVLEDAVAGLRAARDAGCGGLVAVTTTMAPEELAEVADLVVGSLADLRVEVAGGRIRLVGTDGASPDAGGAA